jgi:pyruvate/2-oxoglutarate dehydrogenase complex dihydrolipoamide dehydrogenase (E3) component
VILKDGKVLETEKVLLAVGRNPNFKSMGLENTNI